MSSNYLFDELNNLSVEFPNKKRECSIAYVPKKQSKEKLQEMETLLKKKTNHRRKNYV